MKLVTFEHKKRRLLGTVIDDVVMDLQAAHTMQRYRKKEGDDLLPNEMNAFLRGGDGVGFGAVNEGGLVLAIGRRALRSFGLRFFSGVQRSLDVVESLPVPAAHSGTTSSSTSRATPGLRSLAGTTSTFASRISDRSRSRRTTSLSFTWRVE